MILLLFVPIWFFAVGSLIVMGENYYTRYSDISNYTYLLIPIIALLLAKIKINLIDGMPIKLLHKLAFSVWLGGAITPYLNNLHIRCLGNETLYNAEVLAKQRVYQRGKLSSYSHYIEIMLDNNEKKRLDYAQLYHKVEIGSQIQIKQRTSALGYSISYKDIRVLKNQTQQETP